MNHDALPTRFRYVFYFTLVTPPLLSGLILALTVLNKKFWILAFFSFRSSGHFY